MDIYKIIAYTPNEVFAAKLIDKPLIKDYADNQELFAKK